MLSTDGAACVTGVPLWQVHQIINAGLLGSAAARRERSRTVHREGLVSLKLAHETTAMLSSWDRSRFCLATLQQAWRCIARQSG